MTDPSVSEVTAIRQLIDEGAKKAIRFYRYSGSGNSFIITDEQTVSVADRDEISSLCNQHKVDGCIIALPSSESDCRMVYLNRDGSRAAMCGNGLRCVAHFASTILFPGKQLLSISTDCGIRRAFVKDDLVEVEMGSIGPPCIRTIALQNQKFTVSWINSGVPHAVLMVRDIDRVQVESIGKMIRNHEAFIPSGTNVTFTEQRKIPGIDLSFRTYERGVESETLACGTGAVAAAVISWDLFPQESCLRLQCASKEILRVRREFEKDTFWYFLQGKVSCLGTV